MTNDEHLCHIDIKKVDEEIWVFVDGFDSFKRYKFENINTAIENLSKLDILDYDIDARVPLCSNTETLCYIKIEIFDDKIWTTIDGFGFYKEFTSLNINEAISKLSDEVQYSYNFSKQYNNQKEEKAYNSDEEIEDVCVIKIKQNNDVIIDGFNTYKQLKNEYMQLAINKLSDEVNECYQFQKNLETQSNYSKDDHIRDLQKRNTELVEEIRKLKSCGQFNV